MTEYPLREIEELFHAAVALPAEAREAFVRQQCEGDERRVAGVMELLRADCGTAQFHEMVGESVVAMASAPTLEGTRVGAYVVERELGRGGMGAVFLAARVDDAYHKKAAIKFVDCGWTSPLVHARFRSERQILANLDHPYIAHMLDGGALSDGRPYLVMEFVEGETLTRFARRENLDTVARVVLFRKICEAVQYAHSCLVIHRDIKPANVLVQADGTPKLLDFGISRLQDSGTHATGQTSFRSYTAEYCSPEQFQGLAVTTSTDIYALGAVLYELMAGAPPFHMEGKSWVEMEALICRAQPEPPSMRGHLRRDAITRDLDAIALKAMRKATAERYGTVGEMIADIDRALAGEPILAKEYSRAERTVNFLKRYRLESTAAALVVLSLSAGLAVSIHQTNAARAERRKAEAAATEAQSQRIKAEASRAEAARQQQLAQQSLAIAERRADDEHHLVTDVLLRVNEAVQDMPGATAVRKEALKASATYLDRLVHDNPNNEALLKDAAAAYGELAALTGNPARSNQGDIAGALPLYAKSRAIYEELMRRHPENNEFRMYWGKTWGEAATVLNEMNQPKDAEAAHERAVAILSPFATMTGRYARIYANELLGYASSIQERPGQGVRMLDLLTRAKIAVQRGTSSGPERKQQLMVLASILGVTSKAKERMGDRAGALTSAIEGARITEQLLEAAPEDTSIGRELALRYVNIGDRMLAQERTEGKASPDGALVQYRKSKAIAEKVAQGDPADRQASYNAAVPTQRIARVMHLMGNEKAAVQAHREALDRFEMIVAADPGNAAAMTFAGLGASELGECLERLGETDSAAASYRRGIEIAHRLLSKTPGNGVALGILAVSAGGLANMEAARGEAEAEMLAGDLYTFAEKFRSAASASDESYLKQFGARARAALALSRLADSSNSANRRDRAESMLRGALEAWSALSPKARNDATAVNRELASAVKSKVSH